MTDKYTPAAIAEMEKRAARYEYLRKMTPAEFTELYTQNLKTGVPFDDLVDAARAVQAYIDTPPAAHPALGTEAWFANLNPKERAAAREFVAKRHKVYTFETDETGRLVWAVAFVDTDFWADAFEDKKAAEDYAMAWNNASPASSAAI